jgi:hypothetical protein
MAFHYLAKVYTITIAIMIESEKVNTISQTDA